VNAGTPALSVQNRRGSSTQGREIPALKWVLGSVLPGLLILAWWWGIQSGSAVVPAFSDVWGVLVNPFREPEDLYSRSLAFSIMLTLMRLGLGYSLAVLTAVPLGILAGRNRTVEHIFRPMVEIARPINPVVLLPVITVLLGVASLGTAVYGQMDAWRHDVMDQVQIAMIVILWYGAFFPVYTSTVYAVRNVRSSYLESMWLMRAGRRDMLRWVILPHILPSVANGMRVALGVSWLVIIAAEIFPGTRSGLGYMLCTACKTSEYEYTFAAIIVIGIIGLLSNGLLRRFEQRVSHWKRVEG